MKKYTPVVWVLQIVLIGAVAWFVVGRLRTEWASLQDVGLPTYNVGMATAAGVVILSAFLTLIAAWRSVLRGWAQTLRFDRAALIWSLSNLGRYLPGKIWSVAGMAILAKREGVEGWAAAGAALVMQGLALTTGALIGLVFTTGTVRVWMVIAAGVLGALIVFAPTHAQFPAFTHRMTGGRFTVSRLSAGFALTATAITAASWILYGVAVWFLFQSMSATSTLSLASAIGAHTIAYIVGLLAVFAPGGAGVREGTLIGLLEPIIGLHDALVLAISARILFTLVEFLMLGGVVGYAHWRKIAIHS